MQSTFRRISPFLILLLAGFVGAAEPKKPTKDKIKSSGYFVGKVTVVEVSGKNFTAQIEYVEPDPNKVQALQVYIAQATLDINRTTNPTDKRNKLASYQVEIAKRKLDLNRIVTKDVKLEGGDDLKVRLNAPPLAYDDKGKVKKYTRKELSELKGPNKKLPGYTGDFENLRLNQTVKVYLAKQKKKSKKEDKDPDLFEKRLKAVMVVILKEPPMK